MEQGLFPTIAELLNKYVEIRLDTDPNPDAEKNKAYQERLTGQSETRPTYVIVDPRRPEENLAELKGAVQKEFVELLKKNVGS